MAGYSVTYTVVDQATAAIEAINRRIQQLKASLQRQTRELQRFVDVSGLRNVAKGFEDIGRSAFSAFESISRIVPGLAAITSAGTVAGMVSLANATAQWARSLAINSDQLRVSADQLQTFQGASQLAGISIDTLIGSMKALQDSSKGAFLGTDAQALVYFRELGVNVADANGKLRDVGQLLPEVVAKLNAMRPEDRKAFAEKLGGGALDDLTQKLRESGKTLQEWEDLYHSKFANMSTEQQDALRRWRQSYAETETAFDHLGRSLGATLARDFEPFLRWVNAFVEKHEPEIVDALEKIGIAVTILGGLFTVQIAGKAVAAVAALSRSMVVFLASPAGIVLMSLLGIKAAVEHPGDVLPGAGLLKSFRNIMEGKAPWENYFPDASERGGFGSFGFASHRYGGRGTPAPGGGLPARTGAAGPGGVSMGQMKQLLINAGFTPSEVPTMAAILMHESSGNPNARNSTSGAAGLAQVNPGAWGQDLANQSMGNAQRSAEIARMIYLKQGYGAWESYNKGYYQQYMDAANVAKPEAYGGAAGPTGGRNDPAGAYGVPGAVMNYGGTGALGKPGTNLTQLTTSGGLKYTVNAAAAEAFQGFVADLEKTGYPISSIGGYANRSMRGGTDLSEHAFANAIDVNPAKNAMGGTKTDMPANIAEIAAKWGLIWGGKWSGSSYDPMHFQWGGSKPWQMQAGGAAVNVTGGKPVTGSVDVTVTHRNPPPDSGITATATGAATVGTPRVEQQQLAAP